MFILGWIWGCFGFVCFGLDLFLLFKFQQDDSGLSLLKMRDAVGLKELNMQEFLGICSWGVLFPIPVCT